MFSPNFEQLCTTRKQNKEKYKPRNFLRNAKQEFPCQNLESFSREYYNLQNKILEFRFEPVCAKNKLAQITVLEATNMKQQSSMTD